MLAALALITFVVFLKHRRVAYGFVVLPAAVMVLMPIAGLLILAYQYGPFSMLGGIALAMVVLGAYVITMSLKFVMSPVPDQT